MASTEEQAQHEQPGKPGQITLYRFRVRAADGRRATSGVFATRSAPTAHLAGAREASAFAAGQEPGAKGAKGEEMLANPRWSDGSFAHGEPASMRVDAPGLDGRTVRFHVEHKAGDSWTAYETVEAKVENGAAEAQLQLHHPAPGEEEAGPADLRFACELL